VTFSSNEISQIAERAIVIASTTVGERAKLSGAPRRKGNSVAPSRASELRGRIIHAAVALFSRQGYHRTSTREIARLADVSEVTIFRYFDHKDEIFWTALQSSLDTIKPRLDSIDRCTQTASPEIVLPEIIGLLIDVATFSPEIIRLIAIALLELRGKAEEVCLEPISRLFTSISGYLALNMESGRVRNLNPTIVTIALASTAIAQPEVSRLLNGRGASHCGDRKAIDEYSDFWLNVLVPTVN
jgi:AcrR family transcriptional regulator